MQFEFPAQQGNQPAGDGQTESGSANFIRAACLICPVKALENSRQIFFGNANAIVKEMADAGHNAKVFETLRTAERQEFLYGFGRQYDDGRGTVTKVQDVRTEARKRVDAHLAGTKVLPPDTLGPLVPVAAGDGHPTGRPGRQPGHRRRPELAAPTAR